MPQRNYIAIRFMPPKFGGRGKFNYPWTRLGYILRWPRRVSGGRQRPRLGRQGPRVHTRPRRCQDAATRGQHAAACWPCVAACGRVLTASWPRVAAPWPRRGHMRMHTRPLAAALPFFFSFFFIIFLFLGMGSTHEKLYVCTRYK